MDTVPTLRSRDLTTLPVVSGCSPSPDGSRVAFAVTVADDITNSYRGRLSVVSVADMKMRDYTTGTQRDSSPRWSADGRRLFFLSNRGGRNQPWSIAVDGGEAVALGDIPGDASAIEPSPDGRWLAVLSTPDEQRRAIADRGWRRITKIRYRADGSGYLDDIPRIWLLDLHTGASRSLTDGSGFVASPAWSRDSSRLAFVANHDPANDSLFHHELWVADSGDQSGPRQVLRLEGAVEVPAWSPDGKRIAFLGVERGDAGLKNLRLFTVDCDGKGLRCWNPDTPWTAGNFVLTDTGTAGNFAQPVWLSGDQIAILGSDRGCCRIFVVSSERSVQPLTPATHSVVEFNRLSGDRFCAVAADSATPPEVYASDDSGWQRLTHITQQWCDNHEIRRPERFEVRHGDVSVDAWWLPGRGAAPRPAVLQIHGGPHFAYGEAFFFEFQLLAAAGIDVVYCNPRGSQTYGEAFSAAIVGDFAAPAFDDCMAALDTALEHYPIDRKRLAVAGGSYGGYLTAWAIAHTDRFAAAISMRPATDLTSLWGTSEVGRLFKDDLGGMLADVPEVYRRCSPLTYVERMNTPLLIIHSENDYRCPIGQAEQLFTALISRGRTVELLRLSNADHGLSRTGPPRLRVVRLDAILEWLRRYVPATAAATSAAI